MAYILNYPDTVSGKTLVYLRIRNLLINKATKFAKATVDVFSADNTRVPVREFAVEWADNPKHTAQYTSVFGAPPVPAASLPAAAVNVDDIQLSQAYNALKTHPVTQAMLASATVDA